jgi:hypothetical protein
MPGGLLHEAEGQCDEEGASQEPNKSSVCLEHSTPILDVVDLVLCIFILVIGAIVLIVAGCKGSYVIG